MIDVTLDEKTLDCKQAVFFGTGSLSSVVQQFVDVQEYCKIKQLPLVNIFIEESNDEQKLYAALNKMLEFLAREKKKLQS